MKWVRAGSAIRHEYRELKGNEGQGAIGKGQFVKTKKHEAFELRRSDMSVVIKKVKVSSPVGAECS
jgi:hypothetical protein